MAEGKLNPREKARLEQQKQTQKTRMKYVIIGAVIVLMAALVIFVNSRLFTDGLAALRVGDMKYTVADVNYEYRRGYMQFAQAYGDSLSIFLDSNKPLNEQPCMFDPNGGTWDDYFKNNAEISLVEATAYYKAAMDAGYTLTEEDQAEIDGAMNTYSLYAGIYGYSLDGYLAANYGAGNNEKTVRRHMEQEAIINRYLNDLYNGAEFTDAEKEAYYNDHAETNNQVNALYYYLPASEEGAEETVTAIVESMEDESETAFRTAVLELTGEEANENSYTQSGFMTQYEGAVQEDELTAGTVFTHGNDSGWYAVYVLGLEDNHYNTVSVRHILIKAVDEDGDGEYSDEEKQAAYDAVVAIQDEWLAGDATEDSFAALAQERSEDAGSVENGGLYEDIHKGQMVKEFNDFCFGEHEHGDYDIVYGESSSYAGYHLIYFVGADGDLYSNMLAENGLRSEKYNDQIDALTEGLTSEQTFMWRYVMKG